MYVEGNVHDKAFRKSAKTVGNVIGNYHPHGDSSVYEAMVRLSQTWKVRNVLVEMHGNNGSVDGDQRQRCVIRKLVYHQSHLNYYVILIKKQLNSCQTLMIRVKNRLYYQPFPNLLVNGSTGISAGYATEIPPHHLGEVIDATMMRIDKPNSTVDDLLTVMKGPDFPTGGIIQGIDGIKRRMKQVKVKLLFAESRS